MPNGCFLTRLNIGSWLSYSACPYLTVTQIGSERAQALVQAEGETGRKLQRILLVPDLRIIEEIINH